MGKIILNTDIGQDIDDALALGMLVNSNHDLLGIVTTGPNPRIKAKFAKKLLSSTYPNLPIFYGLDLPKPKRDNTYITERDYHFLNLLDLKATDQEYGISSQGLKFMMDQVTQHPKEVTILSIAPHTNLGELLKRDPSFALKVKAFYLMGGCISRKDEKTWKIPSYNLRTDLESFRQVIDSGAHVYITGKDSKLLVKREEIEGIVAKGISEELVAQFKSYMNFFSKNNPSDTKELSDPLLIGAYLFPGLYNFQKVEPFITEKGQMYGLPSRQGNVYGCFDFDCPAVKQRLLDALKQQGPRNQNHSPR